VLARVDRVLDLSWLKGEIADCYCLDDGRPGIDPEVAVRLMLAGLLIGIVHDRKLMREAQVNIRSSLGEFSVAKHTYVESKCGWFSDRTGCYLASGRPAR
jgi:hypothetical protein